MLFESSQHRIEGCSLEAERLGVLEEEQVSIHPRSEDLALDLEEREVKRHIVVGRVEHCTAAEEEEHRIAVEGEARHTADYAEVVRYHIGSLAELPRTSC